MDKFAGRRDITMRRHIVEVGDDTVVIWRGRSVSTFRRAEVVSVDVVASRTVVRTGKRSYRMSMRHRTGLALQRALV